MSEKSKFRSTSALELPSSRAVEVIDLRRGSVKIRHNVDAGTIELPDEALLRTLIPLDFDDLEAVREFIEKTGNPDVDIETGAVGDFESVADLFALEDVQRAARSFVGFDDAWDGWQPGDKQRSERSTIDIAALQYEMLDLAERRMVAVLDTYVSHLGGSRLVPHGHELPPAPSPIVLAGQLYNHIAEGSEPLVCANERCLSYFLKQQGRAKHDQRRRSGVKYCKDTCNKAQHARNARARDRAADATFSDRRS